MVLRFPIHFATAIWISRLNGPLSLSVSLLNLDIPLLLPPLLYYWNLSVCVCVAAENESHEGKRKVESQWPIFKLHHQRSRYIYDLYYKRRGISKELYDFCIKEGYADANLIAKWKKVRHLWFLFSLLGSCQIPPL